MGSHQVFLSYKHSEPSTEIANTFYLHLDAVADGLEFSLFMDTEALRASDIWKEKVDHALRQCTHFIALLSTRYWLSGECRRELNAALYRFETTGSPKLLFVLAEAMRPDLLAFDKERNTGQLKTKNPIVRKVADVQFLGPFDRNGRLVRLAWEKPAELSDQFAQLLDRLEATM